MELNSEERKGGFFKGKDTKKLVDLLLFDVCLLNNRIRVRVHE